MWNKLFEFIKGLVTVIEKVNRLESRNDQLLREMQALTLVVHDLANKIARVSDREIGEREKLVLQLENELLKFERRNLDYEEKAARRQHFRPED